MSADADRQDAADGRGQPVPDAPDDLQLRAIATEFERRRGRVVLAIVPAALLSLLGVLFLADRMIFLVAWPLMLFALGAYVHRVFRCPRCERPIRGRPAKGSRCLSCGVSLEYPPPG